ncbi:MAG TPA: molecular chaperone TorD family protein [Actinomycetota bacterium]
MRDAAIDVRPGPVVQANQALARSAGFQLGSQLLAYPTPAATEQLLGEDLPFAEAVTGSLPEPVRESIRRLRAALADLDPDLLEGEYRRIFSHVHSADCPLYETDFIAKDVWRQSQELADLAGFYRAFGMEVEGERPDSAAVELEFLHVLAFKAGWALAREEADHAEVCERAEVAFLRDHALRWIPSLVERIAAIAGGGPYGAVAALIRELLLAEAGRRGLEFSTGAQPATPDPELVAAEGAGLCEADT